MDASRGSLKNQGLGLFVSLVLLLGILLRKEVVDFKLQSLQKAGKLHGKLQWIQIHGKFFPLM